MTSQSPEDSRNLQRHASQGALRGFRLSSLIAAAAVRSSSLVATEHPSRTECAAALPESTAVEERTLLARTWIRPVARFAKAVSDDLSCWWSSPPSADSDQKRFTAR